MEQFTQTENALITLSQVFFECKRLTDSMVKFSTALSASCSINYASRNKKGNDDVLDLAEMNLLLKKELVHLIQNGSFEQFDADQDGSVTFSEFMSEIAKLGKEMQEKLKTRSAL